MLDNIPTELVVTHQWVNWEYVTRGQKTMKMPIDPKTGSAARSNDHNTWSSFYDAYMRSTNLGFVITDEDAYIGIDFDHCVSDGVIHPNVQKTMRMLNSYSEYSPSGEGIHIFVKGTIPCSRKETNADGRAIEIYAGGRYLTMTGNHIAGTPLEVCYRQDELDAIMKILDKRKPQPTPKRRVIAADSLDDDKVLERMMNAKNGDKFKKLWSGDLSLYNNDHSKADLALCNMLWFYTKGNEEQVDRLFRMSGLMRDKWDSYRGAKTYGEIILTKVQN